MGGEVGGEEGEVDREVLLGEDDEDDALELDDMTLVGEEGESAWRIKEGAKKDEETTHGGSSIRGEEVADRVESDVGGVLNRIAVDTGADRAECLQDANKAS